MTKVLQVDESAFFLRRFSLAIGSSGDDAKSQETPGKSGGLVSMKLSSEG